LETEKSTAVDELAEESGEETEGGNFFKDNRILGNFFFDNFFNNSFFCSFFNCSFFCNFFNCSFFSSDFFFSDGVAVFVNGYGIYRIICLEVIENINCNIINVCFGSFETYTGE